MKKGSMIPSKVSNPTATDTKDIKKKENTKNLKA
jgi:hypothetical protein